MRGCVTVLGVVCCVKIRSHPRDSWRVPRARTPVCPRFGPVPVSRQSVSRGTTCRVAQGRCRATVLTPPRISPPPRAPRARRRYIIFFPPRTTKVRALEWSEFVFWFEVLNTPCQDGYCHQTSRIRGRRRLACLFRQVFMGCLPRRMPLSLSAHTWCSPVQWVSISKR